MRKMMALAAATGAMGVGCTKEDTIKSDNATDKPVTNPVNTTSIPSDSMSTTPSDTATTVGPPTPPSAGYMVVDMLPPPAKCAGASSTITPTAAWKTSSTGAMGVEVRLRKSTRPDVIYSSKSTPSGYGGTIVATSLTG